MLIFFYLTNRSCENINANNIEIINKINEYKTESSTEKVDAMIWEESLLRFLDMRRSELISTLGAYSEGTLAFDESHMVFPVITFNNGLTFYIGNSESSTPTRISCSEEISIRGVNRGMNFLQVQEQLGQTDIIETWIANEHVSAYKIQYDLDELHLEFISYEKDGFGSDMIISKLEDNN
jgi:hypothetical protein